MEVFFAMKSRRVLRLYLLASAAAKRRFRVAFMSVEDAPRYAALFHAIIFCVIYAAVMHATSKQGVLLSAGFVRLLTVSCGKKKTPHDACVALLFSACLAVCFLLSGTFFGVRIPTYHQNGYTNASLFSCLFRLSAFLSGTFSASTYLPITNHKRVLEGSRDACVALLLSVSVVCFLVGYLFRCPHTHQSRPNHERVHEGSRDAERRGEGRQQRAGLRVFFQRLEPPQGVLRANPGHAQASLVLCVNDVPLTSRGVDFL